MDHVLYERLVEQLRGLGFSRDEAEDGPFFHALLLACTTSYNVPNLPESNFTVKQMVDLCFEILVRPTLVGKVRGLVLLVRNLVAICYLEHGFGIEVPSSSFTNRELFVTAFVCRTVMESPEAISSEPLRTGIQRKLDRLPFLASRNVRIGVATVDRDLGQ